MVRLLKSLSGLFFVEDLGFSVLGNHVHIVVRAQPGEGVSDDEIRRRLVAFYGEEAGKTLGEGDMEALRARLGSVSSYMKEIKESFTRYYNKKQGRQGFFWGGRFKSVLVEDGDTLLNVLAYVDLNAVRAGIVERPEAYRWCSLGYHIQAKNKDDFLSLDFGLAAFGTMGPKARLSRYRKFVYEVGSLPTGKGASIDEKIVEEEEKRGFELRPADCFRYRTRYFTDSGVIGSKEFVSECYVRFQGHFNCRREKRPTAIRGIDGVYSLKRLRLSA